MCSATTQMAGDRSYKGRLALVFLSALLLLVIIFSLAYGESKSAFLTTIRYYLGLQEFDNQADRAIRILLKVRMPRVVLGVMVGAALAVSGTILQGLFKNPLADPGLIGVSSGAGLGAVVTIVLGGSSLIGLQMFFGDTLLPLAAFCGGLITTMIIYRLATQNGRTSIAVMLLAGIALAAITSAVTGLITYQANDQQLRDIVFWTLGSLNKANWSKTIIASVIIAITLIIVPFLSRGLNALALGEPIAYHLGIPVQRIKNISIICVSAAVGASVAVCGGIGFVGIIVPHLLRLIIGPNHKYLLPCSALLGAIVLLIADTISRTILPQSEVPIGIITALIGGPFFIWILMNQRRWLNF
ncbi:iron ABC transporter permease [Bartonella sp. HY329]|uniref:FecCD family ABC transporter permease n=1 Tax=unclassified Bartonella TaxID=2645622 RepID=UPI0021C5CA8E|nr:MULTISPECIES: iron ABC transporter permease [unclassified Bartonella]UXM94464.1 iron ABC transporter permease [Bartonella sp. HY329]UXN08788.1 iron ABC transporter permease [Bartonella sp. HY328]